LCIITRNYHRQILNLSSVSCPLLYDGNSPSIDVGSSEHILPSSFGRHLQSVARAYVVLVIIRTQNQHRLV
jgi:hypothetical protein